LTCDYIDAGTGSPVHDIHPAPVISLAAMNGLIYGLAKASDTEYRVYEIDPLTITSTIFLTYACDTSTRQMKSLFLGGPQIIINPIIPLKTINSVTPASNNISIKGSKFMTVTQTSNDTIVFSLPVKDANLNVTRTAQYA
jgi:hypothetical protein